MGAARVHLPRLSHRRGVRALENTSTEEGEQDLAIGPTRTRCLLPLQLCCGLEKAPRGLYVRACIMQTVARDTRPGRALALFRACAILPLPPCSHHERHKKEFTAPAWPCMMRLVAARGGRASPAMCMHACMHVCVQLERSMVVGDGGEAIDPIRTSYSASIS